MFKGIKLEEQLRNEKAGKDLLLEEVAELLENSQQKEEDILKRLNHNKGEILSASELSEEEKKQVYSLGQIKNVCIKYRLRFLDSRHFKSEFPYEAILKIKAFEEKHQCRIEQFKIIAPDAVFNLQDVNKDPLLFAQLGNNRFYLIHQWGNDLAWFRPLQYYAIRNIYTYLNSIFALAVCVALAIPFSWMMVPEEAEIGMRFWLSIHFFIALFFFILFLGSVGNKRFSEDNWNSQYFNS